MASVMYFDNRGTMLVHFLLLPIANMLLLAALSGELLQGTSWSVAAASVLTSGCLMVISSLAASFTADRSYGIDREMLSLGKISWYYWGCKLVVCSGAALGLIAVNLVLLALMGCDGAVLLRAAAAVPQVIYAGTCVGFFCMMGSWGSQDPYRLSNFFTSFGNVLAGAVVVVSAYPAPLRAAAGLFPLAHTLSGIHGEPTVPLRDTVCATVWLLLGLVLYRVQLRRIAAQSRFSTL